MSVNTSHIIASEEEEEDQSVKLTYRAAMGMRC